MLARWHDLLFLVFSVLHDCFFVNFFLLLLKLSAVGLRDSSSVHYHVYVELIVKNSVHGRS